MGMVFLGEHMLLGRRAAIKTLLPTVAVNREIVERFFNEARATSAISDPGVIQVFDFGYHVDGTAYIVMELLEGEALSARIERLGKLSLADALRIARQIAGSLAAAHARGIVHRDLKPENIFMVADAETQGGERSKILDFGICKLGAGDSDATVTQSGAMIGTPCYMSPEQCRGAGGVDHRADIYAFGCLVFYMLTGRPPFDADAPGELIVAHLQAEPVPPSAYVAELPPEIDTFLLRCLAKSPDERYQSMAEIQLMIGELYAQLGCFDAPASAPQPAMLLGRGFRSMYDANHAALGVRTPRNTPVTDLLRANWFERTPSDARPTRSNVSPKGSPQPSRRVSSSEVAGPVVRRRAGDGAFAPVLDDDVDLETLSSSTRSKRVALACVAVIGVAIGLVATSFVTYGARSDRDAHSAPPPHAALAVEADPAQAPTAATEPAAVEPAPAPAVVVVEAPTSAVVAPAPAPAVVVEAPTPAAVDHAPAPAEVEPARAPAVVEAAPTPAPEEDLTSTSGTSGVAAAAVEPAMNIATKPATNQTRSSREAPREFKKPPARPRSRPAAVMPQAPSGPSEDLYDTR
jgi:serine/threonine protein kinase